ncbi:hypothetical protein K490DRAFT_56028 [Saccharata proteae CBS 121410]|uniref:Uncharacterized protein n=1 Tax=Saccharata proteae CBS 121410 TaxID=1314787 RepID=A0A9P4LWL7_9PEZI|nr:hypothetical protein K490DRAFT_56028 [Saccharata proteae CBS 121410]
MTTHRTAPKAEAEDIINSLGILYRALGFPKEVWITPDAGYDTLPKTSSLQRSSESTSATTSSSREHDPSSAERHIHGFESVVWPHPTIFYPDPKRGIQMYRARA